MFSGHSDVVPVTGQEWHSDPFTLTEEAGKLFGRGTADMKSFIAVVVSHLLSLNPNSLKNPIYLAITYDEEIGCLGVGELISYMKDNELKPEICIVGEPTMMHVGVGHKGASAYDVEVHSRSAHSSMAPIEVNSIELAVNIINKIIKKGEHYKQEGPFDYDYRIPFATFHTGVIRGGVQVNIVPDFCNFEFEFRTLASQDPSQIEKDIYHWVESFEHESKEKVIDSRISMERKYSYPGLQTKQTSESYEKFIEALSDGFKTVKLAFGTEAGSYQHFLDVCSVVCGPGDIAQAHQPDEYIEIEQIELCEKFIGNIITAFQK